MLEGIGTRVRILEGEHAGRIGRITKFSNYSIGVQVENRTRPVCVPYDGLKRVWWFEKEIK